MVFASLKQAMLLNHFTTIAATGNILFTLDNNFKHQFKYQMHIKKVNGDDFVTPGKFTMNKEIQQIK